MAAAATKLLTAEVLDVSVQHWMIEGRMTRILPLRCAPIRREAGRQRGQASGVCAYSRTSASASIVLPIVVALLPAAAPAQLVESTVGRVFPPAPAEEYQPCTDLDVAVAGWCLERRISEVARISGGEFSGTRRECRLTYPENARIELFQCGSLIVRLRLRADASDLESLADATIGQWTDLRRESWYRSAVLRVTPGTERSAFRSIIYHPAVLWVEFNRFGVIYQE